MVFAENIRNYCSNNGISNMEFEKRCGLSNGIVYKWEKGIAKNPNITTLQKIETATRIPMSRWLRKGGVHAKEG